MTRTPPPGTFRLELDTSNAAFTDDPRTELAAILEHAGRELVDDCHTDGLPVYLRDTNGNRVGHYLYVPELDGPAADIADATSLPDALARLGWRVTLDAGDYGHDPREADRAADQWTRSADAWTWTIRTGTGATLRGGYWTGPLSTGTATSLDAFACILEDAATLEDEAPWIPDGIDADTVELIRDRAAWLAAALGSADALETLTELAREEDR